MITDYKTYIPLYEEFHLRVGELGLAGKQYVTINRGADSMGKSGTQTKVWAKEYYDRFVELFQKEFPQIKIVQLGISANEKVRGVDLYAFDELGGKKELEDCRQQKINFAPQVVNTIGKLSVLESIALMTSCVLVVGADTGLMHGAAAAGVDTLTLFGSTDASLVAPYGEKGHVLETNYRCSKCYTENNEKGRTCKPAKCMQAITVDEVWRKISEL